MKTKSKQRESDFYDQLPYKQHSFPKSPKPTTLLDVWGTDVERVILEDGNEVDFRIADLSGNGEWWRPSVHQLWRKTADTRVAYVFPPEFKVEMPAPGAVIPVKDQAKLNCVVESFTPIMKREKPIPAPWYVRLDDWLKRLVTRNGAKS